MQEQKAMDSESDQVVEIKIIQEECNHRIVGLFSHPGCEQVAQICEKKCKNNLAHDFAKIIHDKKTIEQFKSKFTDLQSTSTKETQHYIRQLDEAQKNAIDNIAKKKQECLKEIKQFKKQLMKQTYPDLESKFPNLYEKFKNERFDTLNCNEVAWVMKMEVHHHTQKHSAINAKLLSILKKFETFKDVSKNLTHKVLINKEKVKEMKVGQKNPETVIKLKPNLNIEKPNYSQDKNKYEVSQLQKKKRQLQASIRYLSQRNNKISDELSTKVFLKRQKQNRIRICSKILEIHIQNINTRIMNSIGKDPKPSQNSHNSSLSLQINLSMVNPHSNLNISERKNYKISNNQELVIKKPMNEEKNSKFDEMQQEKTDKQHDKVEKQNEGSHQMINQQQQQKQKQKQVQSNVQINEKSQNSLNQRQEVIPTQTNPAPIEDYSNKAVQKQNNKEKKVEQEPIVKTQFIEDPGFVPWRNRQLISQMKKYGKEEKDCLKVENIDALRSFATVRLPSAKMKIASFLKTKMRVQSTPQKTSKYQNLAKSLVDQFIKKGSQNDDKKL